MRFRQTQQQLRNPLFMGSKRDPWITRHPSWLALLVSVFIAGCLYLVYGLPAWQMTKLKVSGQYTLPLTELRTITRAQQQSRWLLFFRQTNLWAFDTRAYERRLRERWMFTSLTIKRSLPDTLVLNLKEEQPAFLFQFNDRLFGIDRNGTASTFLLAAPTGVPQLIFLSPPELKLGEAALTTNQASFLNNFLGKLLERHDEKLLVTKITVAVSPETTLRLGMVGDWEVIVNSTASAEAQAQALLLAYDQKLKGRKLEYVDVSVPDRVYVK